MEKQVLNVLPPKSSRLVKKASGMLEMTIKILQKCSKASYQETKEKND